MHVVFYALVVARAADAARALPILWPATDEILSFGSD
jgi:hypothetical protein